MWGGLPTRQYTEIQQVENLPYKSNSPTNMVGLWITNKPCEGFIFMSVVKYCSPFSVEPSQGNGYYPLLTVTNTIGRRLVSS